MKQINLASLTFAFLFGFTLLNAQNSTSIQISGGLISPMHAFDGLGGTIQIEKKLDSVFSIYAYTGYYAWYKNRVNFIDESSMFQKTNLFQSYNTDDHKLIPLFVGAKINLHTNNYFLTFLEFEFGYSHLSYNSFQNRKSIDPLTGAVVLYYADQSTRKSVDEDLFGFGLGAGIYRPLSKIFGLIFSYKLSTHLNSSYNGFFESKGTYSQFMAGFNFIL